MEVDSTLISHAEDESKHQPTSASIAAQLDASDSSPMKKRRKTGRGNTIADDEGNDDTAGTDDNAEHTVPVDSSVDTEMMTIALDEEEDEEPTRKRLTKQQAPSSPSASPTTPSTDTKLRPKKDLSAAEKKKIIAAQAEKKNQPSLTSFFGGAGGGAAKPKVAGITSFFKPKESAATKEPTKETVNETTQETTTEAPTTAFVDESGNITTSTPPAAASSSPTLASKPAAKPVSTPTKKPTAGKRKRDGEKSPALTPTAAPTKSEEPAPIDVIMEETAAAEPSSTPTPSPTSAAAASTPSGSPASPKVMPSSPKVKPAAEKKPTASAAKAAKPAASKVAAKPKAASTKKAVAAAKGGKGASKKTAAEKEEEEALLLLDDENGEKDEEDGDKEKDEEEEEEEEEEVDATKLLMDSAASSSSSSTYDPVKSASWKFGEDVPFAAIAHVFERLEEERSRLLIIEWLSDFFRSVIALTPHQLVTVVYLACNEIAPAYAGERTNVGDRALMNAIGKAVGKGPMQVAKDAKAKGDLGEVALESRGAQSTLAGHFNLKKAALTCQHVFSTYVGLAATTVASGMVGPGSAQNKANKIHSLLVACEGSEAKYIVRGLQGNLRIHMAEKTVIAALARAFTLTTPVLGPIVAPKKGQQPTKPLPSVLDIRKTMKPEQVAKLHERNLALLNQAYIELPNHRKVIEAVLEFGIEELPNKCYLEPGIPVKVMLGKPCNGVELLLEKFGLCKFTLEYKYDGARAQIHMLNDGSFKIYSRNSQDDTGKYPDVLAAIPKAFNSHYKQFVEKEEKKEEVNEVAELVEKKEEEEMSQENGDAAAARSSSSSSTSSIVTPAEGTPLTFRNFIIDCEVVAWDAVNKKILPFQALTTRKKKDVKDEDIQVKVCLFGFDLLFLNDVNYMNEPLIKRRSVLRSHFHEEEGLFHFATYMDTADPLAIGAFLQQSIRGSCEGLMVKGLEVDATYVPNKRNWFKLKKDYLEGLADSLDLVVIGAWHGKGKRTGGYGAFLLATYDRDSEDYQSICAIGTGLSDADLDKFSRKGDETDGDATMDENGENGDSSSSEAYFRVLPSAPRYYKYPLNNAPDVFVEATRVWEIKCADLSISPAHFAARGKDGVPDGKGIALRFPRLERERPDKIIPEGITSADQVLQLFQEQSVQGGTGSKQGRPGGGR